MIVCRCRVAPFCIQSDDPVSGLWWRGLELAEICVLADFATSCAAALCFSVETTVQMPEHELKQGKSDD